MTVETDRLTLRVTVAEVWAQVEIAVTPETTIEAVKAEALRRALHAAARPDDYLVKHRGALILDEAQTAGALGLRSGEPLIVLPARRRPVH